MTADEDLPAFLYITILILYFASKKRVIRFDILNQS